MSFTRSPFVASSQLKVHGNLTKVVNRYLGNEFQNSIPKHTCDAFNIADKFVQERNAAIILDSGCGTGESTYHLAQRYPEHTVIGIDKSSSRLQRYSLEKLPNQFFVQSDCISFWQLALQRSWRLDQHFLLYPNPWPKPGHLQRRWHAHPVFPQMLKLGGTLVMRTNWEVYAQEFIQVLGIILDEQVAVTQLDALNPMTAHERKYLQSQHALYEVRVKL